MLSFQVYNIHITLFILYKKNMEILFLYLLNMLNFKNLTLIATEI